MELSPPHGQLAIFHSSCGIVHWINFILNLESQHEIKRPEEKNKEKEREREEEGEGREGEILAGQLKRKFGEWPSTGMVLLNPLLQGWLWAAH